MSWARAVSLFVIPLLAATPPASAQDPASPDSDPVVGCYALDLGTWEPPLMAGNEPYQTPPDTVRLTAEIGEPESIFERGRTLVRPVIPAGRTPSAYWWREAGDTIRVVWTNGFSGVRLFLSETDSLLVGRAEAHTDVMGRVLPRAEVTLQPTECGGSEGGHDGNGRMITRNRVSVEAYGVPT